MVAPLAPSPRIGRELTDGDHADRASAIATRRGTARIISDNNRGALTTQV
jgi:hypothetical protein